MAKIRGSTVIDTHRCKGCGLCIVACPLDRLTLSDRELNRKGYLPVQAKDTVRCRGCAFCAIMCPDSIITVRRTGRRKGISHG